MEKIEKRTTNKENAKIKMMEFASESANEREKKTQNPNDNNGRRAKCRC